ncbi:MAG: NrfD/PsrC family molybdoenzyme membrane anchor subunit [Pseudomonadota bacterium]|nr:NrfD/PsrC family molybdoenzyme membrane anchor subunit [Pseudomonadota bacterium]MDP1902964.1 NrfD/PsrC family molybdoenzyme membrane anchor subunit [Pseudomonadota bacterium]MDP2352264.1 NrfD/PsrC family molybdoenzyme membrane anchor subunit [Pseudomonadota bacterium]
MYAFFTLEHHGHVLTGMNNQIVWGLPHVFAVFLIVAASGALNVASIGSVFGKQVYKSRAPLSGMLALALLAGGLAVLVLDLGRPDRLIVAMTHYNFKSIFAWNMIFYNGFFVIVGLYLVTLMDRRLKGWTKPLGYTAFFWRLSLTTATGSIFGFLVARAGYNSALMAPMFVIMSFAYGLAVFMVVQSGMYRWNGITLDDGVRRRMKNLLAVFVGASLYFTVVFHLTNLYFAKQWEFERFILLDGGIYTTVFWVGQIFLGGILPLILLFLPRSKDAQKMCFCFLAPLLVILGGFAQMYVTIVGGQAFPLPLFPGHEVQSSFYDGVVNSYQPSVYEWLLAMGGVGVTFLLTVIAVRVFKFMPQDDFKTLQSRRGTD